ncbi:transporter [Candidatus Falkowbacteria bacterium CG_4_9_14_3_um_filter_36_9]|uniref:Probable queuosine precursor transporter n=1 Tax=Candidatus Falkowbacteria bacterium CG02_land_8_20_14_3_00_36_14 TaxID=1974560 RepID=A0A2M7DP79_9BACT|nr:MAG: transporter [Candidatus Falkowbacteria bacterium CG02_land_8_20_14_3_00_36_14]PJA11102.1 MAG: transporter [Candidatus Falkowbacteria bacterium CG_4_10_14_0_2_um_filter_36_22]PJB18695.1 MAG: transporter [Candidatus Falkowbacteria bacterium CG_4_9_14_3_um_filter_36_9]
MNKKIKFYDVILGLFVASLIISNVVSAKILKLGPFTFDGGTILFPLVYIFGDIFTEVYGYAKARRIIWIGFMANLLMAGVFMAVGRLAPAEGWENQSAYEAILGMVPRIVVASLTAYLAGEFLNSYIMAKIKIFTKGKKLYLRTISSTLIGQAVDTLLFVVIAFAGVLPASLLFTIVVSNYIFKCGVEILFTPITYKVIGLLKRAEEQEVFDYHTNFNPFKY